MTYKTGYGDRNLPPDLTRCCEEVRDSEIRWPRWHQCTRKNGHGPDGAYCKQHDPAAVKARDEATRARHEVKNRKWRMEFAAPRFYAALKQIADGHNDARQLAADAIREFERK